MQNADDSNIEFQLLLNEESAKQAAYLESSIHRWDVREVGTLTIKCEDWTTEIPIWTALRIAKETSCAGVASYTPWNMVVRSVTGTPTNWCKNCQNYGEECCGYLYAGKGCGGVAYTTKCCKSELCNIDDPCGMAWTSTHLNEFGPVGSECERNNIQCTSQCIDSPCGCCGCVFETSASCDTICPPYKKCAPYVETQPPEALGCYDGSAHEEDEYKTEINLTLEFKLFEEME